VLATAKKQLPKLRVRKRIQPWKQLAEACPVPASFDLAELRGYHYHSGVVFDAYCEGDRLTVARAGATTTSARRSGARGRRPDFPSICEARCGGE
jgi:ATP phosphoribosyltransferase regulatory subunit HisZ